MQENFCVQPVVGPMNLKTSYTVHYTNNQCLKMIIPGMIQDYDDDPQDDLEGEEDQEQVPEGEGEGEATEFSDFQ